MIAKRNGEVMADTAHGDKIEVRCGLRKLVWVLRAGNQQLLGRYAGHDENAVIVAEM